MSENILVVEYEPRYTDRVRQALAGQPFTAAFAKDGEEAIKALDEHVQSPRLIVLSSIVPKISTTDLIRAIRGRAALQRIPILLTVSGYNGKSPRQDAERVGASDILPKPYSEHEFLGKVQQMLGIRAAAPAVPGNLTSDQIFGDILDDDATVAVAAGAKKPMANKPQDELDKLLADTLGGVMPRKKDTNTGSVPKPAEPPKKLSDLDQRLSDTLSGLEKSARRSSTSPGNVPIPKPPEAPVAPPPQPPSAPAARTYNTEKLQAYVPDRVPVSQPVLTPTPPPPAPPAQEEEPSDGTKFGQYVLLDKIATGGMAEVWKARMKGVEGFQKIVAIKKILPHLSDNQDFIEMFVDEAKLAAQLNHNNIIHIYDLGKIANSYYIAMEYVDGHDLKTILKRAQDRDHPMGVELALLVTSKLAAALDYAHRKRDFEDKEMGLVHRDVSPQNVLISEEGDIKLCDFGIAKAASKASHTQAGALKGKLQYMSPEQAWGRNIDRRSDIFALATVLFEMLTGRKLFTGDNELSILEQVREARIVRPSEINDEVTPEIDAIVLKALQKDPAQRYQTAGEMERDINQVLYSFRPTPTSADLAIYMHRVDSAPVVPVHHPEPEPFTPAPEPPKLVAPIVAPPAPVIPPAPVAAPVAAAAVPVAAPAAAEPWEQPREKKSAPIVPIAIALLVLGGAAAGYFALRGRNDAPVQTTSIAPVPAATTAAANTATIVPVTDSTATTATTSTLAATSTTLDPSLINAEVQKRLAAERARLDAEARARAAQGLPPANTATTAPARPQPVPQPAAVTPQPQTPAPVPQPAAPVPQPVVPAPQPAVAETRPTPQPAAPQTRTFAPGEIVPPGTEGLVPPRVVRQATLTYPPIAKQQRVGGTVIMNVLVSETGDVLEVRVVRGVPRAGINDAAIAMMRRTTFGPGTLNGQRVRSWATVPIEFKP